MTCRWICRWSLIEIEVREETEIVKFSVGPVLARKDLRVYQPQATYVAARPE